MCSSLVHTKLTQKCFFFSNVLASDEKSINVRLVHCVLGAVFLTLWYSPDDILLWLIALLHFVAGRVCKCFLSQSIFPSSCHILLSMLPQGYHEILKATLGWESSQSVQQSCTPGLSQE